MNRFATKVRKLYANAIQVNVNPRSINDDAMPLGASKIGGCPDISPEISWPTAIRDPDEPPVDGSMSFIGQFNMEELHAFDRDHLLPAAGVLSFFKEPPVESYIDNVYDDNDETSWEVLFNPNPNQLQRATFPENLPPEHRFRCTQVRFTSVQFLPHIFDTNYTDLSWSSQEKKEYHALEKEVNKSLQDSTHLLGYPYIIEWDMHLECELHQAGIPLYHYDVEDTCNAVFVNHAKEWTLLLQLNSIYKAGLELGEAVLFFWIRKQDLLASQFGATQLVIQVY